MPTHWTVQTTDIGIRLDVFLTREMPETTRSQIAKRIKTGEVTVNGKAASVHRFLKKGDVVQTTPLPPPFPTKGGGIAPSIRRQENEPPPSVNKPARQSREDQAGGEGAGGGEQGGGQVVVVLSETPDWLVINKPSGLLVHPDTKTQSGTLVDFLLAHNPKIAKVGEDPSRPGIMHRLDKEASGLMVIAKTQDAFDDLKHQFAKHSVDKRYLALVYGEMEKEEGDIKFKIARSKTKPRMAARPEQEEEGKAAWTHYRVKQRFRGATLLELEILTGRTHQIRAHLLAMNHPIMGDPLYKRRKEDRNIVAPRLMLQAVHLGFHDPATGEKKEFDFSPDPEFMQCIKLLDSRQ